MLTRAFFRCGVDASDTTLFLCNRADLKRSGPRPHPKAVRMWGFKTGRIIDPFAAAGVAR